MHEFSHNPTIAKKQKSPQHRQGQNPMQCHDKERIYIVLIRLQRPCITSYKRALLGQEIVEIGAPESRLSHPVDPSTDMYVVGLGLRIPSPTPIFTRRSC